MEEITNIEKIFVELIEFVDSNSDAQILLKVTDVTTFLHKSFTDLENLTKNQIEEKNDIYIQPNFRPMYLNTVKALDLIKKFEMIAPGNDAFNTFELKFLKQMQPNSRREFKIEEVLGKQIKEGLTLSQLGQK